MKEIDSSFEIQKLVYEMLKEFHFFCEKHDLRYILAGGTLLGAVRHNGFIPWDDDIDVQMPRPDYERFLQLTAAGMADHMDVIYWETMDNPYFSYAKIIDTRTILIEDISIKNESGVFIDVFPTDGLPDSIAEIKKKFQRLDWYKNLLNLRIQKIEKGISKFHFLIKVVAIPFARMFLNTRSIITKINEISKEQDFEDCETVAFQVLGYGIKEVTKRSDYNNRILMKFVDDLFYIPSNYDQYLKQLYGDYMTLPPKEEQVTHHGFKAYWRE